MNSILSISLAGLHAASARLQASAERVASGRGDNLAAELVEQKMAEHAFKANIAVIKTADRMMKDALDILA